MDVDIAVIGAGPAGCAAAIAAVQSGLSVLIIAGINSRHRATNIIPEPSESIHPGVLSLLEQLQATQAVHLASQGVYEGTQSGHLLSPLGHDADGKPWLGHHINRPRFDACLLDAAILQGAGILQQDLVSGFLLQDDCVVGVTTKSGKEISCKYVIDASGFKRLGGKKIQFEETFYSLPLTACTGITENIDPGHRLFKTPFTQFIPNAAGWTWLAPEPPNTCTWTRLSVKSQHAIEVPPELQNFTNSTPIKAANCRWRIFRPVCKEGIVLCGDAAAILDPAAGQGILNALLAGIKAAKTIASCIEDPAGESFYLAEYDDWYFQYFHEKVQKLKTYYAELGIDVF
ncbi:MAG: tryptophan 7-halogenase [Chitinophagaceae bacterium]